MSGFLTDAPREVLHSLYTYIITPDLLTTDYFVVGSTGGAFVNSALVMAISLLLLWLSHTPLTGNILSRSMLMAGFGLFGKNCLNILPFFLGVFIYCHIRKLSMQNYTAAALYSCALAPMVSAVVSNQSLPHFLRLPLGVLAGALISYILIPIAEHSFGAHMGYTLFNYGFAGGLLAIVVASIVRGISHTPIKTASIWKNGIDISALVFLLFLSSSFIAWGFVNSGYSLKPLCSIMKRSGRAPDDFVLSDGLGATVLNMGIVGLICLMYILIIGGDLNGPITGAILTCMGFAASGLHPKNIFSIMLGVFIATFAISQPATAPALQMAALFGTTLAPIAGQFGTVYGLVAGFLHAFLVLTIAEPCGGYNLYNNGFSAGLISIIMVAFIQGFSKKWHRNLEIEQQ